MSYKIINKNDYLARLCFEMISHISFNKYLFIIHKNNKFDKEIKIK